MWAQVKLLVQMYVVICVLGAATCRHHENNNKRKHQRSSQDGSSENEEENLLDVPRRESSASPDTIAERKKAEVPKFMMDLYHRYKDSEGIRAGRLVANTVRSIQPDIGIVNQAKLYVVNLTSIGQYERALKGEIYLYKKRMKSKFRKSDIVITTHELAPTSIRVLSDVILPGRTRGWQALDVTQDLRSCLGSQGRSNHMLAFSFTLKDKNGSSSDLSTMPDFDAFKDILSRPYLVVYSNDTQKLSLDHIEPHFNTAEYLTNTFVNPENGRQEQFIDWMGFNERKPQRNRKNKHRQSLRDIDDDPLRKESELFEEDDRDSNKLDTIFRGDEDGEEYDVLLNLDGKKRNVRSIHDNKIPEDPFNPQWPPGRYNVPPIQPNVLQGTVESRHRVHDNRASSVEELERRRNRKRGRRRHRKNRDRKDGNKDSSSSPGGAPFSDLWTRQTGRARDHAPAAPAPITDTEVCGKRTLVVDFADIGWRDWIIAPTSFKAQYCSGTCPFPLNKESLADDIGDGPEGGDTLLSPYSKLFTRTSPSPALIEAAGNQELNPSNHATIQSLMHLVGINKRVPAPCCAPDKLSSVTLLFFDSNKNVVLKNYPGMTVESCACR